MTVFNNYLVLLKARIWMILAFFGIMLAVTIIFTSSDSSNGVEQYENAKLKISVIDHDNTKFTNDFKQYIETNSQIVEIKDDQQAMKDALFFGIVDYIMIIPQGYTDSFKDDSNVKIETRKVPNSVASIYAESLMNDYLNIARTYINLGIEEEQLSDYVISSLEQQFDVTLEQGENMDDIVRASFMYNYSAYSIVMTILLIIPMMMTAYNDKRIKMRHLVSSVSYKSVNRQLLLGNACVALVITALYVISSFVLFPAVMTTMTGLLLIVNMCIFVLSITLFAYLITILVTNKEAINGIANLSALGGAFISGVFIPQQLLGESVLKFAKFGPMYWFVVNNNELSTATTLDSNTYSSYFQNIGVLLGFSSLFIIVIVVVTSVKNKRNIY